MKRISGIFFTAIMLTGCQTATGASDNGVQLKTKADLAPVIGRRLYHSNDYAVFNANGTISGNFGGVALEGRYEMRDGFFCRTLSKGPNGASPEDCQLLTLNGDELTGVRNRGKGARFTYTIK